MIWPRRAQPPREHGRQRGRKQRAEEQPGRAGAAGDQAKLNLAVLSDQMRYIPSNARVRLGSTTVFGAKSVEFLPPEE